jgi:hypothetical protein
LLRELKLHFLKKLVNPCMMLLDRLLPETEPHYPQTKMLEHMYTQFFHVFRLQVYEGMYDNVPYQTLNSLEDRNFQHFLSASRKILLYIGENDRYYRAWIGLAFILAHAEHHRALAELTREEFVKSHSEQWEITFNAVPETHFQSNKSEFLDMTLSAYLSNLLRMRITLRDSPQNSKNNRGVKRTKWSTPHLC